MAYQQLAKTGPDPVEYFPDAQLVQATLVEAPETLENAPAPQRVQLEELDAPADAT